MKELELLGVLAGKTEDEIIEVALQTNADGAAKIQFCYREWASGIGWYTQKTMEVGSDQVDRLIEILEKSRRRTDRQHHIDNHIDNVVPFMKYGT
jgi:hypothetical protein